MPPKSNTTGSAKKEVEVIKRKAATNENNQRALLTIKGYLPQQKTLQQIADELNTSGFRTAKGHLFERVQVHRLMRQLRGI